MTKAADSPPDDLEATRQVIATLQPFPDTDRERIIRWAREKLGMALVTSGLPAVARDEAGASIAAPSSGSGSSGPAVSEGAAPPPVTDIKSFIESKDPKNGTQFAATAAYYYRFIARDGERKESINPDDLLDAYRKAERDRPKKPGQVLIDGYANGVFDKAGRGSYTLNTVGENLVAMVLPGKSTAAEKAKPAGNRSRTKATAKDKVKKKGTKKAAKRSRT
jgi:hypothetical protein